MSDFIACHGCGATIHTTAPTCPKCGAPNAQAPRGNTPPPPLETQQHSQHAHASQSNRASEMRATNEAAKTNARHEQNAPSDGKENISDYALIPFYRRRWFVWLTFLCFPLVSLLVAVTGPIYQRQNNQISRFATSARWTVALISVVWIVLGFGQAFRTANVGGLFGGGTACDSPDVLKVVNQIFTESMEQMREVQLLSTGNPEFGAGIADALKKLKFRHTGIIEDAKRGNGRVCAADFEIGLPDTFAKAARSGIVEMTLAQTRQSNVKVSETTVSAPIRYGVSEPNKNGEFRVQLEGTDGLRDAVVVIAMAASTSRVDSKDTPTAQTGDAPKGNATALPTEQPKAALTRTVLNATIQGFECGDHCHLKYVDISGAAGSAICDLPKECKTWLADFDTFKQVIGKNVNLELGKRQIPQADEAMDAVVSLKFNQ